MSTVVLSQAAELDIATAHQLLVETPPVLRLLDLTGAARLLPIELPAAA